MESLKLFKTYLIPLLCLVTLSHQTASNGIEDTLRDLKDLLLGSLDDMKHQLLDMDTRLKKMDNTIENEIKEKVQNIELQVESLEQRSSRSVETLSSKSISVCTDIDIQMDGLAKNLNESLMTINKIAEDMACGFPWVYLEETGCILLTQEDGNWDAARYKCKRQGGDLAMLKTNSTRKAVADYIDYIGDMEWDTVWWIGGTNRSGDWMWLDGEPITEGWKRGQPNSDTGLNTCLDLDNPAGNGGVLYDYDCNYKWPGFICQK